MKTSLGTERVSSNGCKKKFIKKQVGERNFEIRKERSLKDRRNKDDFAQRNFNLRKIEKKSLFKKKKEEKNESKKKILIVLAEVKIRKKKT